MSCYANGGVVFEGHSVWHKLPSLWLATLSAYHLTYGIENKLVFLLLSIASDHIPFGTNMRQSTDRRHQYIAYSPYLGRGMLVLLSLQVSFLDYQNQLWLYQNLAAPLFR